MQGQRFFTPVSVLGAGRLTGADDTTTKIDTPMQKDRRMFEEDLGKKSAFIRLNVDKMLHEEQSIFQHIKVFENALFGTILTLDGVIQCTTLDEHIYHEMMVHVPLSHACANKKGTLEVAIIGGGDGGALREVLKYQQVGRVTLCDIDRRVVDVCRHYLPGLSAGGFDDERVSCIYQDGVEWLKSRKGDIDVLIVDSSDDDETGSNATLFNDDFYECAARALSKNGVVVKQSGCALLQQSVTLSTLAHFKKQFGHFGVFRQNVPTYVGGDMQIAWASYTQAAALRPTNTHCVRKADAPVIETKYYNSAVHNAAFSLPKDLASKVAGLGGTTFDIFGDWTEI